MILLKKCLKKVNQIKFSQMVVSLMVKILSMGSQTVKNQQQHTEHIQEKIVISTHLNSISQVDSFQPIFKGKNDFQSD